jgi:hypothetical protein
MTAIPDTTTTGIYDIEVDTSQLSPEDCATAILSRAGAAPTAFARLAETA